MVNKKFWLGILVMVLVFGMTVVGCGSDDGDSSSTGGGFTLTDIPAEYNGKYAFLYAENQSVYIMGCQSVNMSTETAALVQISNGKVSIPMWILNESNGSVSKYSGNDTFTQNEFGVVIFDKATYTFEEEEIAEIHFTGSIVFKNGGAEKSVNNGIVIPNI
jgi:hypothetical protein